MSAEDLREETQQKEFVCDYLGCDKSYSRREHLVRHRKHAHGIEPPRERQARSGGAGGPGAGGGSRRTPKGAGSAKLQRDLETAVGAVVLLPFMVTGNAAVLQSEQVRDVLAARERDFAAAWVAVAEQDTRVEAWLRFLLTGGVWFNAAAQTATLGYMVAVFTRMVRPHVAATMLIPDLAPFISFTPPPVPPGGNGNGAGPQE